MSWSRFKLGLKNLAVMRSKFTVEIAAVNVFISSLMVGALERMEAVSQRISQGNCGGYSTVKLQKRRRTSVQVEEAQGPIELIIYGPEEGKDILGGIVQEDASGNEVELGEEGEHKESLGE
jgi:hypothetical protein